MYDDSFMPQMGEDEQSELQKYLSQLGSLAPLYRDQLNTAQFPLSGPRTPEPPGQSSQNYSLTGPLYSQGSTSNGNLERVPFVISGDRNDLSVPRSLGSSFGVPLASEAGLPDQDKPESSSGPRLMSGVESFPSSFSAAAPDPFSFINSGRTAPFTVPPGSQGPGQKGQAAATGQVSQTGTIDPDRPPVILSKQMKDYNDLIHSSAWAVVSDQDKKAIATLLKDGHLQEANDYVRQIRQQILKTNPQLLNFDQPVWGYQDLNVAGHNPQNVFPGDANDKRWPELKQLVQSKQWNNLEPGDKEKIVGLMASGNFDDANTYAQALQAGKTPPGKPAGPPYPYERPYVGSEIDNFVHSPLWRKVSPAVRNQLAQKIAVGDIEGANAYVKRISPIVQQQKDAPVTDYNSLQRSSLWTRLSPADKTKLNGFIQNKDHAGADSFARGLGIADIARGYESNKQWAVEVAKGNFKAQSDKCNEFVWDVLHEAGFDVPSIGGRLGFLHAGGPPAAAQWADASQKRIGNWEIVTGPPQAGDVIAEHTDPQGHPDWAHVGIVVDDGHTASADTIVYPKGLIVVNDWGFRQDDLGKRVVRRYIPR